MILFFMLIRYFKLLYPVFGNFFGGGPQRDEAWGHKKKAGPSPPAAARDDGSQLKK